MLFITALLLSLVVRYKRVISRVKTSFLLLSPRRPRHKGAFLVARAVFPILLRNILLLPYTLDFVMVTTIGK